MEIRANEEIPIGQDLTPPIPPLSLSLHHSILLSHCSSCFSPLPPSPFYPTYPNPDHFVRYCSLQCSSLDSPLHFSSSEFHFFHLFPQPLYTTSPTSTDLRLSLRLIHRFQEANVSFSNLERIGGLMTNFKKLTLLEEQQYYNDDDDGLSGRIRDGAKAMAVARRMRDGLDTNVELSAAEYAVEAAVLCLVLTNSVEVHDKDGRSIGVGVYDLAFSYVNHSCSPNASYRFCTAFDCGGELEFRICPAPSETCASGTESGSIINGSEACGPRIVLRSIKAIQKSEEVLITYTDLLQPKKWLNKLEKVVLKWTCGKDV
uniref:Protein SET DOMAIN GROUP 41 isoform X2 n=1 Tax=Nicotiana tabacum TaxID=4097 RepID=A0A1S4DAU3_TOBAC|nr:PREDICTED: protein SET DOMAIN GROUP 41-like isoform X2 [Nicotiana tabacum]